MIAAGLRDEGELDLTDASVAAGQFLSLLRGSIHMELLYGLGPLVGSGAVGPSPGFGRALP
ncbi:TetR/AcrR family transcriptional regulator C-terminal domain-containing protein [Paracoccus sp. MKU1]|uniref:TetR/AcrR family transcriptional regulator C-terminal domain-containing protein n=1 Tax=Paracoccus sp. MKU1 TaxID=1745182 RepID=UPI000726FF49|nr:hypothetical protein AQY21_02240 [Paracoccus sp. MKU1]